MFAIQVLNMFVSVLKLPRVYISVVVVVVVRVMYLCCVFSSPFLKDKLVLETEEIERIKEQQIQVILHH